MATEIEKTVKENDVTALVKPQDQHLGEGTIDYLTETLGISSTMLAALLGVTERSLTTWKKEPIEKLEKNSKGKRLVTFYEVVQIGLSNNISKKLILNYLQESVDLDDENSPTLLYYIVHDPDNSLIKKVAKSMCTRFAKPL